eukprot:NODE_124_length_17341_cov_0.560028.p7 type:complete len:339 gc:universal NODE_124_length_17341_cov_0.560028:15318-16334(+)
MGDPLFLTKSKREEANLKDGPFTTLEIDQMKEGVQNFVNMHSLSNDDLIDVLFQGSRKDLRKLFYKYLSGDVLPGRSHSSIYYRVRRLLHPNNLKGKFTPEEDEMILKLQKQHGNSWKLIGEGIGRMGECCRDRYFKHLRLLDKNYESGLWDDALESKLIEIVSQYLPKSGKLKMSDVHQPLPWKKISEAIELRSPDSCQTKWYGGLAAKVWRSMATSIQDEEIVIKKTDKIKNANRIMFKWTFQDDMNLLNAIQILNVRFPADISWSAIAKTITHALAENREDETSAQVRVFTSSMANSRFNRLRTLIFNGKNFSVAEVCLYYLENDCGRLSQLHSK